MNPQLNIKKWQTNQSKQYPKQYKESQCGAKEKIIIIKLTKR